MTDIEKMQEYFDSIGYTQEKLRENAGIRNKTEISYMRYIFIQNIHYYLHWTREKTGEYFNRNHSTVTHSLKTINNLCAVDKDVRELSDKHNKAIKEIMLTL